MGGVDIPRADVYVEERLTPAVNSLPQLEAMREAAKKTEDADVWLQIDSGMTRLGLDRTERDAVLADAPAALGPLKLAGVMSHLSCADEDDPSFTEMQYINFVSFTDALRDGLKGTPSAGFKRALANSFGSFRDPKLHFDLVRPGIALYGGERVDPYNASETPDVAPQVRTVHVTGPVVQVRRVERGAKVGYGATWLAERDSVIACIGIGYADGFHRSASNKGAALFWSPPHRQPADAPPLIPDADDFVNREPLAAAAPQTYRLPLLGKVSMDSVMVDLTDVPEEDRPREGDQVEVLGAHQPPAELAKAMGTIGYEVLTSLGRRYRVVLE